jgi:hypothetical protein
MIEALGARPISIKDQDYDYLFYSLYLQAEKQKSKSCITGNPIPIKKDTNDALK